MRKNRIKSNIWQITLQPKTDTNRLTSIRYIAEWSVKWEIHRKRELIQCKRCQRFKHSASNCMLPYRCVKCINTHEPGKCPIDVSDNKTKPCCVNCKGEHTANNARLCPIFKRQLELIEDKKRPNQNKKETVSSAAPSKSTQRQNNNQTYASTVNQNHQQQQLLQQQQQQQQRKQQQQSVNKQFSTHDIKQIIDDNQKSMRELMQSFFEQ